MFARLGAKLVFATAAIAVVFFGVGLIGLAIATALTPYIGAALGYGVAGAILLLPPLLGAVIASGRRPRKPSPEGGRELMNSIFTALARETPWAAVVGAGLMGVTNLFLNRNKNKK
jgi:uncharacterized membrane protein YdfJ with MMPL/SSD domain